VHLRLPAEEDMNRRTLLQALSVLPIVGVAKPAKAQPYREPAPVPQPRPKPEMYSGFLTWQGMAALLWKNFEGHIADKRDWWREDLKIQQAVCYRFCKELLEPEHDGLNWTAHDFAADLTRDLPRDLVKKQVSFGVLDAPEATFEGVTKQALTRKLRVWGYESTRAALADISCGGLDAEVEMVSTFAHQCAVDVLHEIRMDFKNGAVVRAYGIYLPPHLSPVDPNLAKDFTICRGWRMKYAKFV
jgi:hypothetical protein